MTSSMTPGRPRRAKGHISVRVAHTVLGGAAGLVWLVLPMMTTGTEAAVPAVGSGSVAVAQEPRENETSTADLVLPLIAVGAASALAAYAYVRRTRRRRTPATPGRGPAGPTAAPPGSDAEERCTRSLVTADDCVRTSREELGFARGRLEGAREAEGARPGAASADGEGVEPFARAVREAEAELAAAFRMRQRYDDGVPGEPAARRQALSGIVGRCVEAGRRLDARADAFDALRDLEGEGLGPALEFAETRFRELAGRTGAAESTLVDLAVRFPPSAHAPVTGYAEQAKDRLVFATTRLNQARQSADLGAPGRAAAHLRAAETAIAQAGVFLDAVHRLAERLAEAQALLPDGLAGAEAAGADGGAAVAGGLPAGELRASVTRLDRVLKGVRDQQAAGPYDPVDALRRIVRAAEPLAAGRDGALDRAALLLARGAVADAEAFVATHRGAVGAEARTRLAEARRLLGAQPPGWVSADELARRARDLAEQDVLLHGNPAGESDVPGSGSAGALLGGILLPDPPDTPAAFGGPDSRGRRAPGIPPG
ncbi:hypothetical protein ABZZ79_03965 [Streptomyces sp. NPDC006458]|uniref:hypothetical protein n=1 Tax=Streptomyces sp. NPDC006458 TaxID=3154302 RepID=UPI0033A2D1B2